MTKVAGVIYKSHRWLQNGLGRTKEGTLVQNFDVQWIYNRRTQDWEPKDTSEIVAFSLYGAVVHCYDSDRRDHILEKLRKAILATTGRLDSIAEFNDRPETTYEDVARVIKFANV